MIPLNPLDKCEVCGRFATVTVFDDDGNEHGLCRHCYVTRADSDEEREP